MTRNEIIKNKIMVEIVPHQDDELLVGGSLLYEFISSPDWDVYIIYTTEGASINEDPSIRMKEAIASMKVLGLDEDNIIFLGYGNEWRERHIYNANDLDICTSKRGDSETHALEHHQDYSYQKFGEHHTYSRHNYLIDIKNVLLELMPDVILGVDLDNHQEHVATSLFIDECLGEILNETPGYRPIVLKKFAYNGIWQGEDDYFECPRKETLNTYSDKTKTRNPAFLWSERIRYSVPQPCNTILLTKNILYKAISKHKSQHGWVASARLINSDYVCWQKRTDNLLFEANITSTSGNPHYLNDFKIVDKCDVTKLDENWGNCLWIPNSTDLEKRINITFRNEKRIKKIIIFSGVETEGQINNICIRTDNELLINTGKLSTDFTQNVFVIDRDIKSAHISLSITDHVGNAGISEIEIYENEEQPLSIIPATPYIGNNDSFSRQTIIRMVSMIERIAYRLLCRWTFRKIKK